MNKAQCLICGMVLQSNHRHDFKCCTCGNLCVDGGNDYHKRSVRRPSQYLELSYTPKIEIENREATYDGIKNILKNGVMK